MTITTPGLRLAKARALASTSVLALLAGVLAQPQSAHAQTVAAAAPAQAAQASSVEEIVVTGSRIVRDG